MPPPGDQAPMLPPVAEFFPSSMLEWGDRLSATVILQGCNFRCPFCHSANTVPVVPHPEGEVPWEAVEAELADRGGWLDGVVVTAPGESEGLRFDPPALRVTVEGIPSAVNGLEAGRVAAIVEVGEVPAGRVGVRIRPRVILRDAEMEGRVFIRTTDPEEITVRRRSGRSR